MEGTQLQYMVIERFRNGDTEAVYRRFAEKGRMLPEGLRYLQSWVDSANARCFQIMECEDPKLLQEWKSRWEDLVDFEFIPVVSSQDAAAAHAPVSGDGFGGRTLSD